MAKNSIDNIRIRQHLRTEPFGDLTHLAGELWEAIVTTKQGYCFSLTWAGEKPTEEQIRQTWREKRRNFLPHRS